MSDPLLVFEKHPAAAAAAERDGNHCITTTLTCTHIQKHCFPCEENNRKKRFVRATLPDCFLCKRGWPLGMIWIICKKTLWTIHFVADQLIQIICNIFVQDWRLCKRLAALDDPDHLQKHCHYRLCSKLSFLNYPDYLQHIYTRPAKGRPLWMIWIICTP